MRHSKTTKAMALMLSLVMITSVFVGNTLSRYVTSVSSTDNARVAVWGINAGEDTVMNLFSEDYIVAGKTIAASNTNGEKIMAPGTAGEAEFEIINFEQNIAPEVAYEVKISLDDSEIHEKIKNNPSVQWKLDNGTFGTWDQLKTSILSLAGNESGKHTYAPGEFATAFQGTQTHKIAWQWVMDNSNNVMDTEMGNLALTNDLNAVIKVSITAQQVDDLITNEYILDGADQTVNLNDIEPITIRSSADFSTFDSVEVGGQPLTRNVDYTVESGSTVVTLTEEYLSKLVAGTYIIDIISNDVTATTKFEVEGVYTKNMISFTIENVDYQAEEGMTWFEWSKSEYNTSGIGISMDEYDPKCWVDIGGYFVTSEKNDPYGEYVVVGNDVILEQDYYSTNAAFIFYLDENEEYAEIDMTWEDWLNSDYNSRFDLEDFIIYEGEDIVSIKYEGEHISLSDCIVPYRGYDVFNN